MTDRAIVGLLQVEGRLSNLELAERVRLTPSPCLRRVRNLEESGVITGYRAVIDPAAVGRASRSSPTSSLRARTPRPSRPSRRPSWRSTT
ncbi:Lrp/AsnC family transcriptional regulator [Streptosporangium lutulentum]